MEIVRDDGRTANQLRPLACSRNILNRAHGSASWSQGDTKVLAAVYGPKAGTKKNENPEKACIDVIWKPKTGQIGKQEKEYEMILKRTLKSICLLNVNPNTTTSIIIQVVSDDGAVSFMIMLFTSCMISSSNDKAIQIVVILKATNGMVSSLDLQDFPSCVGTACAALADAAIPLKHLAVAICCCLTESGYVILDPTKLEEEKMKAFAYLVFPNSVISIIPEGSSHLESETMEHGIITSVTHGVMSVDDYLHCLERGQAASAKMSAFLRRSLQSQAPNDPSKAG